MQQALTSPVARAVVVGGLLLASSLALSRVHEASHHQVRLVLHAVSEPDTFYLSWWRDGDVRVEVQPGERPAMMLTCRAWLDDGCLWKGIETLEPIDAGHYAYAYDEVMLRCGPGATPDRYRKTPRTGIVTVED
jgi:hypothetical protein